MAKRVSFDPSPLLETEALARTLEFHEHIDSTNDRAKVLARAGALHGTTVAAGTQTHGRGQRGRNWHSPQGTGLYCSVIIRPKLKAKDAPLLPLLTGVAVHKALSRYAPKKLALKWPNDLWVLEGPLKGKKVAGILVEASAKQTHVDWVVIGVGINLHKAPWPPELAEVATSIEALTDQPRPAQVIFADVFNALEPMLLRAEREGCTWIPAAWQARAYGLGEAVCLRSDDHRTKGQLLGVAESGAVMLSTPEGCIHFHHGELRFQPDS